MRDSKGRFIKRHTPWHKGRTGVYSQETLAKMSKAKWKGDSVGYAALHEWVRKEKGRTKNCEQCSRKNVWTDMANLSGQYRRDLSDWIELCRKCHSRLDRPKIKNQYGSWNYRND